MRKVIMWNLISLDGHFEGAKPWDLDFHYDGWGKEMERIGIDQLREAGTLLFGRVTYEGMAAHWPTATGTIADLMNRIEKIVFSSTLERADWRNTRVERAAAEEAVAALREGDGGDLLIFGSGRLCRALARRRLIDEYRIGITPSVIGEGRPLFGAGWERMTLRLRSAQPLETGAVVLRYEPGEERRA